MSRSLKAAIEANDPDAVRKALKGVKDINRKLPGAKTPLLHACERGADRVLEVLFEAGAVAERRHTFPGDTPFAVAAEHKQAKVLERLWALKQASDTAVTHALQNATIDGHADALELILKTAKPRIGIELFRLAQVPGNAPAILKLLVKHGGDVRARHDSIAAAGMTPLHDGVSSGKPEVIRALVDCGAEVNARDGLGRTPLMVLAASLESIEVGNAHAEALKESLESGESTLLAGQPPTVVDGLRAVKTLLDLGADATLADKAGNDAIDHHAFEMRRCDKSPDPKVIALLRKAGAKGSASTLDLFAAIQKKNLKAMQAAIKRGADVNRLAPPLTESTPLAWASSGGPVEMVELLLNAGADPNQYDPRLTPLIRAARSGNLPVVKRLVAAGADIHAVEKTEGFADNAYSAARDESGVQEFLKSLGAGNPKPTRVEPLKPGVGSWNDFSELLVKTSAEKAAAALARIIKGKVQRNAYGRSLQPGKRAYALVRPKGMDWCNVFQIAPPPLRFEDSKKKEAFAARLAGACRAPVLSIEYSDTSDAASILRVEPDGTKSRDQGWDRATLEEMVEAMGDEAPAWARKRLATASEDDPDSMERLVMLAEQEKFVVAAFGLACEPGRKLDVEFLGYGPEAFDGVAFVSD